MDKWLVEWADVGTPKMDKLLADGWEPFAVVGGGEEYPDCIYFRKRAKG